ncbi:MAG: hypothetical protein QM674_11610 [Burkholderiaceae bacterium]
MEEAVEKLTPLSWEKGWLAIRQTIRFDKDGKNPEGSSRLVVIEKRVRPKTLIEQTKAVVLTSLSGGLDITDGDEDDGLRPYERAERYAEDLGRQVAADRESLKALLPCLVENKQGRQGRFGFGLAKASDEPEDLWCALVSAFESIEADARGVQILLGFLGGLHEANRPLFEQLLDDALENPVLSEWVPVLQTCTTVDERGCDRLMRSLERGVARADKYQYLAYGRAVEQVSDSDMARLAHAIAGKKDGLLVALEILATHLREKVEAGPAVASVVRKLMPKVPSAAWRHHQLDFSFKRLIGKCMAGPDGEASAKALLRGLRAGFADYTLSSYDFEQVIAALFAAHPIAALDELVDACEDYPHGFICTLTFEDVHRKNPLDGVPLEMMVAWCWAGSSDRWSLLASSISAITEGGDQYPTWTESALELIRQSPEPMKVAHALACRIVPMSWSGSRAAIMSKRLPLLEALDSFLDGEGLAVFRKFREDFERQIERERAREQQERNPGDNSFE